MRSHRLGSIIAIGIGVSCGALAVLAPAIVHAGGFEVPDNGTEALGRGGAFVAKADDGTAMEYNPAGFARQRGTRITLDANLIFHDNAFTRAGTYPMSTDPNHPAPYGGQPYPTVHDSDGLQPVPLLTLSTDFGWFERWTFALGFYAPSSIGAHNYNTPDANLANGDFPASTVKLADGTVAPGPARYDISRVNLLIVLPGLSVAGHPFKWLDVGASLQMVYGNFDLANANLTPIGKASCPTPDYPGCDAYAEIKTSGLGFSFSVGALAHPTPWLDVGVTYHAPGFGTTYTHSDGSACDPGSDKDCQSNFGAVVGTTGTIHATPPPGQPHFKDFSVTFGPRLPQWLRLGGRVVSHYSDGTEKADLELDLTWENWSVENSDRIYSDSPDFFFAPLTVDVTHNYKDTFGVRVGGSWNFRLGELSRAIVRAGVYYDSAATDAKDTRLDFNTAEKLGLSIGLGYRWKGLLINLAYAYIWSPTRDVTNGDVLGISATNGTNFQPTDAKIVVNNGKFEPMTQILSIGLTINIDQFRQKTIAANHGGLMLH